MTTVAKRATPAAIAVLRQATALRPNRKKASDGLLPSAAHLKSSPNSDHNTGYAVDLTHDPKSGIDCFDIYAKLQSDPRVKYLIFQGKIWSVKNGEARYTGSNPRYVTLVSLAGKGNNTQQGKGFSQAIAKEGE